MGFLRASKPLLFVFAIAFAVAVTVAPRAVAQTSAGNVVAQNEASAPQPAATPVTREQPVASNAQANADVDPQVYGKLFRVLFAAFAVAVLLESALALIFNWRPFILRFDGRGVRSVVALAVGWLVAASLKMDILSMAYNAVDPDNVAEAPLVPFGYLISGLVLAGGSSGVNSLFTAFGFRQRVRREDVIQRPEPTQAWLAVRLTRKNARGSVNVFLEEPASSVRLIGTIAGRWPPPPGWAWALTDRTRFPTVGGYAVPAGSICKIWLEGQDKDGGAVKSAEWGPFTVGAGAILDFELLL